MALTKYKLSEVVDINARTLKKTDHFAEIQYLDTSDITENKILEIQTFNVKSAPSRAQRRVKDRTIIISMVRPNLRHFGILSAPAENFIVSTGFCTLDIKDSSKIDAYYLYYLLSKQSVIDYLQTIAENSVSAYPSINPSDIAGLSFDFPSIEEQREIARVLNCLDEKIILDKAINDNLEALAKQLYDYWFVQFDFPDENGRPYKSSGGKMVWNEKLNRSIPEGWRCGQFSDIANITMGQSPEGKSYNSEGRGMLFYQGSTDFGLRFPSVRQYTTAPSRLAKKGDILMSVRAPVGTTNIANNDCCIGRGLAAINSKIGSITHIYYVLNGFSSIFKQRSDVGTTFGSITKDELYSLPVIVPDETIISTYEKLCKPIFSKQMILGEEVNTLTKQRDELLPLLMNGQVSVNYHLSDN